MSCGQDLKIDFDATASTQNTDDDPKKFGWTLPTIGFSADALFLFKLASKLNMITIIFRRCCFIWQGIISSSIAALARASGISLFKSGETFYLFFIWDFNYMNISSTFPFRARIAETCTSNIANDFSIKTSKWNTCSTPPSRVMYFSASSSNTSHSNAKKLLGPSHKSMFRSFTLVKSFLVFISLNKYRQL